MAIVGGRHSEGFPDFGAIFMSNRSTKDECFNRGLFGLPLSFANFVKHVKAGMLLFLFEYEERNLYGVFEATSDGRMNIIPDAYRSSGKSFPAQVRFRVVWRCRPLSENCFRDAIRDNYYAANKFSFGLSKEQVQNLVWLFDSSRVRVQKSLMKRRSIKSSDRKMDFAAVQISENSSSGSPSIQLQRGHEFRNPSNYTLLLEDCIPLSDPGHCDPGNFGTPCEQTDSIFTSEREFTAQITKNSSSGSQLIQLQRGHECRSSYNDSLLLEDYIPLSDPEHCDPAVSTPCTDCSDGNDQSDSDDQLKVKSLYCDTTQKRLSVFSRLQFPEDQHKKRKTGSDFSNGTMVASVACSLASKGGNKRI